MKQFLFIFSLLAISCQSIWADDANANTTVANCTSYTYAEDATDPIASSLDVSQTSTYIYSITMPVAGVLLFASTWLTKNDNPTENPGCKANSAAIAGWGLLLISGLAQLVDFAATSTYIHFWSTLS